MSFGLRPFGIAPFGVLNQRVQQTYNETVSDSITLTDSVAPAVAFVAVVSDTNTPTDTVSAALSVVIAASDTITLTDSVTVDGTGGVDTHDGFTWREYRRSLRQLAKIAEERRQASVDEAAEIGREIRAALADADELTTDAITEAASEVLAELPSGSAETLDLQQVEDWTPIYNALRELRVALQAALDEADDEEVLLLL